MALFALKFRVITPSYLSSHCQCRTISKWIPKSIKTMLNIEEIKVRQAGDPILRSVAETVDVTTINSPEFKQMVERMLKVMRERNSSGIAAPQIGVGLRVFAMEVTGHEIKRLKDNGITDKEMKRMGLHLVPTKVFINPELRVIDSSLLAFREGCLSVQGCSAIVPRAREVEITALDMQAYPVTWRTSGWPARIIQHEVDHLKGNLYVDSMLYKSFVKNDWKEYADVKKQ